MSPGGRGTLSGVRRAGFVLFLVACGAAGLLAAVVAVGPATAWTLATTGTTATTTTGTQPPPPPPVVIAEGVTIGGVRVGGLSPEAALSVVRTAFAAPLVLRFDGRVLRPPPARLGATAYVRGAVNRARAAAPGTAVPLFVRVRVAAVRAYVAKLARRFDRKGVDARLVLRRLRPVIVRERLGRALMRPEATRAIVAALRQNSRLPIRLRARPVRPAVTRASFSAVIVIRRQSNRLYLYRQTRLVRVFGVATGQSSYPTPLGRFSIVVKWRHPWWYPPDSDWARGAQPIPPGPGNPLGTRWMGLSAPGVGIHGTPDAASIGYSVSHGCIRMRIPEAEWLFERVPVGTPVFIVRA